MKDKPFSLILITLSLLAGIIAYPFLPDILAIQWQSGNTVSNQAPKYIALALSPLVMVVLHATRSKAWKFVQDANRTESKLIFYIVQLILLGGQLVIIGFGLDYEFNLVATTSVVLGVLLIVAGNFLHRAKRSYAYGIKNRWTLSSKRVWSKTHQFSAYIFILAGLLLILIPLLGHINNSMYTAAIPVAGLALCYGASCFYYYKYKEQAE